MKQIYICVPSVSPGLRRFACCSHYFPPLTPSLFSEGWKKNTLAFLSFENRATPKTIRAGSGGVCAKRILKELGPSGYTDSFPPLFWLPKTKEFQRKIRAGPHPEPPLPLPPPLSLSPPPPPLSLSLFSWLNAPTQTHSTVKVTSRSSQL